MAKTWNSMKAAADYNKGRHALRGDRMTMGRFSSYAPSSDLSCSLGRANGRGKKGYTFKHEKQQVAAMRAATYESVVDALIALGR